MNWPIIVPIKQMRNVKLKEVSKETCSEEQQQICVELF